MWTRRNKIILISVLVPVAVVSIVAGSYRAWLATPPALPQSAEEAIATIGSPRFERMPDYRKREYVEQARRLMRDLPEDERTKMRQSLRSDPNVRDAMGQVMRQMMVERATAFARAAPADRARLLDEAIDEMTRRRAGREGGSRERLGRSGGGAGSGGGGGGGRPPRDDNRDGRRAQMQQRMMQFIQKGNPQTSALIGEYFRALRQRREERGLGQPNRRGASRAQDISSHL